MATAAVVMLLPFAALALFVAVKVCRTKLFPAK